MWNVIKETPDNLYKSVQFLPLNTFKAYFFVSHLLTVSSPSRRLCVLREYLEEELSTLRVVLGNEYDLERAIDDWVFLCFFVGMLKERPISPVLELSFH